MVDITTRNSNGGLKNGMEILVSADYVEVLLEI